MKSGSGRRRIRLFVLLSGALILASLVPLVVAEAVLIRRNRRTLETLEEKYLTRSSAAIADHIANYYDSAEQQLMKAVDVIHVAAHLTGKDPFTRSDAPEILKAALQVAGPLAALRAVNLQGQGSFVGPERPRCPRSTSSSGAASSPRATAPGTWARRSPPGTSARSRSSRLPSRTRPAAASGSSRRSSPGSRSAASSATRRGATSGRRSSTARGRILFPLGQRQGQRARLLARGGLRPVPGARHPLGEHAGRGGARLDRAGRRPAVGRARGARPAARVRLGRPHGAGHPALCAVCLAGALLLGLFFARQLSRPIAQLADSTRAVTEGQYGTRVEVAGTAEIADLSENFNRMSESIHDAFEKVQKAAKENQELFVSSIRALAAAIDAKDPYTRGHSERVARYSAAIARSLELPAEDVRKARLSGILHDVGKIGIDDRIIRKPTALTDEEFELMKAHPSKGAAIMEAIPQLADIIPGMKWHHEKWEGGGYPDGLKGEQIPLQARIVAVADAFDAMTTTRPYQKAMEVSYVLQRLREMANKRFDSSCVEALVRSHSRGELIPADTPVAVRQAGAAR